MMIGREFNESVTSHITAQKPRAVIEAQGIRSKKYATPVDFTAYQGEIVGIFGLVGAGRTELARVLFGIDKSPTGSIKKDGKPIKLRSANDAIRHGIGMVPEDRKELGLITKLSIQSNLTLVKLRELPRILKSHKKEEQITNEYIEKLSIAAQSQKQLVSMLSGGNQQKVVLSKWISLNMDVLILDEPTRGVDVKAKAEIYEIIRKLANEGTCIIMISSDLPEILRVSQRVMVMHDGVFTLDQPVSGLDQEKIMYAALN
ncbi:MAG: ATP-binding cassette domain-containing protein [Faecousia sp.]